jgi:hypothetical protein
VPSGLKTAIGIRARQRVYMRSAPAYLKQPSLRAFWSENGDWHTRRPAGLHTLRVSTPNTVFTPCLQVRKQRFAYAAVRGFCFDIWFWAHFLLRKKTGFAGLRFAPATAPPCLLRTPTIPCVGLNFVEPAQTSCGEQGGGGVSPKILKQRGVTPRY